MVVVTTPLIDRDVRFVLLSEGHARQFLPALARLRRKIVYVGDERVSAGRLPTIRAVIERSPCAREIETRSLAGLFDEVLGQGPGVTFVFPVRVGLPTGHYRSYAEEPAYERYMSTPLADLPNRVVILNETWVHRLLPLGEATSGEEQIWAVPHVHKILCRSLVEERHCRESYRGEVPVETVGDLFLDDVSWPRHYGGRGPDVALLTSTQRVDATATIEAMLADLDRWRRQGNDLGSVVLKEHPGSEDTAYRSTIVRRCREWGCGFEVCERSADLSTLYGRLRMALVQDSSSSHLAFRRHGVESFFYRTGPGLGVDGIFFHRSEHPDCSLGDQLSNESVSADYDEWVRRTFQLDGRAVERFFTALQPASSR